MDEVKEKDRLLKSSIAKITNAVVSGMWEEGRRHGWKETVARMKVEADLFPLHYEGSS